MLGRWPTAGCWSGGQQEQLRDVAVGAASWCCSSGTWSGKTLAAAPGCAERRRPRPPPLYDRDVGKGVHWLAPGAHHWPAKHTQGDEVQSSDLQDMITAKGKSQYPTSHNCACCSKKTLQNAGSQLRMYMNKMYMYSSLDKCIIDHVKASQGRERPIGNINKFHL